MTRPDSDTEHLLDRAASGDESARRDLFDRHRLRLKQMIVVRMDRRLAPRFDPSDVVQEALLKAHNKFSDYLVQRPVLFYPWLREIAWQKLIKMQRQHLHVSKRSVLREDAQCPALSDESAWKLADRLALVSSSPSEKLLRSELRRRVQGTLEQLSAPDRELLLLRYVEQLSLKEIACILKTTDGAIKVRHLRALQRLQSRLAQTNQGSES